MSLSVSLCLGVTLNVLSVQEYVNVSRVPSCGHVDKGTCDCVCREQRPLRLGLNLCESTLSSLLPLTPDPSEKPSLCASLLHGDSPPCHP